MFLLAHDVLIDNIGIDTTYFKVHLPVSCYYLPFVIVLPKLS